MATLNYMLGRELLKIIDVNKDFFLKTIAPNPKNLEYFVSTDAPRMVCDAYKLDLQPVPIKSITGDIKKSTDKNILIVEFGNDFVKENLDNYAIVLTTDDDGEVRLFTYEKGTSITGDTIGFVCEFTLDGNHKNYGSTNGVTMGDFVSRVIEVLIAK